MASDQPDPVEALARAHARIAELEAQVAGYRHELGTLRLEVDVLSSTDGQSGLPNLNGLQEAIAFALSRLERDGEAFGIVSVTIPQLSTIARAGDRPAFTDAVRHAGGIIRATVRAVDAVGRLDNDSFMVVMPELEEGGLDTLLLRLRSTLTVVPWRDGARMVTLEPLFAAVLCNRITPLPAVDLIGLLRRAAEDATVDTPAIRAAPGNLRPIN